MSETTAKKGHGPKSKASKIMINLLVSLLVGAVYFYIVTPAINFQAPEFYGLIFLMCVVYLLCSLLTSGLNLQGMGGVKEYFRFVSAQSKPVAIIMGVLLVVVLVGELISLPVFRASAYRNLLTVENGDFATDIAEISLDEIPRLDIYSTRVLGDRQMGTLSDMVSQFEVSYNYTQINYKGRPVRVAPLEYADLVKWFTNRGTGLPAYVIVDMVTQDASVIRLPEGQGITVSPSEPLNRNIYRFLRFHYPTTMFATPVFEIDDDGNPWWIAPKVAKTIGLFGGTDINGAILVNAITRECYEYALEDIPTWVDNVYNPQLIAQQYDYYGSLVHGFINSIFGQRDTTVTTDGSNYIALNDDVYMYTGVTSMNSDQSNLGFLLSNQRTKETKFYVAQGATESSAMASAMGMVQDLGYTASFPILLNISGEPTYFMALKDNSQLVKQYAMVNVAQYTWAVNGATVEATERAYLQAMGERGVIIPDSKPQTTASGTIAELRSAVLDGNTYYFIRLEGEEIFYSVSAAENNIAVILNVGDEVTVEHATDDGTSSILAGYTVKLADKADVSTPVTTSEPEATPAPEASPAV